MPYREPVTNRVVYWLGESGSGFKPRSLNGYQDVNKIKAKCFAERGCMFEDEEFPANEASIGTEDAAKYVWKRPFDISDDPQFIIDNADRFDIRQGHIGNCWLLAAVADLTLNEQFLRFVLTDDNSFTKKYYGVFHFRFWQYGKWVDVTIDDKLPCKKTTGKLAFMHSEDQNEYWGALLEKAFAKLNGSYAALQGGYTFQGLQDLTGGFTEIFILNLEQLINMKFVKDESELFDFMKTAHEKSSFMGSSVKAVATKREKRLANGLVAGHAYSVTGLAREVTKDGENEIELVRLRNPWGDANEWKGDFSDNSPCWEEYFLPDVRHKLGVTYRADGEFWMTVTDYLEQYNQMEICHVLSESTGKTTVHSKHGQWTPGVTAGGPLHLEGGLENARYETNPQFLLTLNGGEPTYTVFVCLMKSERKAEEQCNVKKFAFDVFDISNLDRTHVPVPLNSEYIYNATPLEKFTPPGGPREVTIRYNLAPGNYVIIPSTGICECGANFFIRVITDKGQSTFEPFDKSLQYDGGEVEIHEQTEKEKQEMEKYEKLFAEVAEEDNQVDWWELKMTLDKVFHAHFRIEGFGFSEDECRSMVSVYDTDCSGKLEFYEFMKLWLNIEKWKKIFDEFSRSQEGGHSTIKTPSLGQAFAKGGYSVTKEVLSRIVLRYGDRYGQLELDKFITSAVKLEAMFEQFRKIDIDHKNQTTVTMEDFLTSAMYS